MLRQVNVQQSLADRLVFERRGMRLEGAPVLGIGPFLVRIKFVGIGVHRFLLWPACGEFTPFARDPCSYGAGV